MKKLRIGILGCADIANRLVIPNIKQLDQFELVAVASRSVEKANTFAARFGCLAVHGYENLILRDDIDCVYIPLPNGLHHEWIMKSLKSGKHVLAEKPFTEDYTKTQEIIALADQKKCCVYENFMFTYHSQFDHVFKLIQEGEIGEVRLLRSSFGFPEINKNNNIRYKKQLAGGAVLDAGAYTVRAASFFLGSDLEVIGADLNKLGNEVDFQGSAMLRSKKGIVAQLAFGFDNFYQNTIEIWGSKGKISLSRAFTAREGFMPGITIEKQNEKTERLLAADNQMQKILLDFYSSVQSNYGKAFDNILLQSKLLTDIIKHAKI
jgi:predicted dehydrogenase